METTTNSIATFIANTPAKGRFGVKNIISGRYPKFEPNRYVAGMKPAQSAINFVVFREKFQANTSLAAPANGLRSLANLDATSYISINRTTADTQGNLIGGVTRDARQYSDIDSKLLRLYDGEGSISIIKHRSHQKHNLMHLREATSAHLRVGASA